MHPPLAGSHSRNTVKNLVPAHSLVSSTNEFTPHGHKKGHLSASQTPPVVLPTSAATRTLTTSTARALRTPATNRGGKHSLVFRPESTRRRSYVSKKWCSPRGGFVYVPPIPGHARRGEQTATNNNVRCFQQQWQGDASQARFATYCLGASVTSRQQTYPASGNSGDAALHKRASSKLPGKQREHAHAHTHTTNTRTQQAHAHNTTHSTRHTLKHTLLHATVARRRLTSASSKLPGKQRKHARTDTEPRAHTHNRRHQHYEQAYAGRPTLPCRRHVRCWPNQNTC